MKIVNRSIVLLALITLSLPAFSQLFTVDADLRNRFEYRDGYKKPASELTDPTSIFYQRGRVAFNFKADSFQVHFSFQDARIWGQNGNSSEANSALVHESWLRYWISPSWSFKIGRQAISYDDKRVFDSPDWAMAGKSYDAGLAILEMPDNGVVANIGGGINRSSDDIFLTSYTKDCFRFFTVGYLKKSLGEYSSASLLSFVEGNQKAGDASIIYPLHTFGSNIILSDNSISSDFSVYVQHGENETGATLLAGALALKGTYESAAAGSFYIGGAYYTGTSQSQLAKGKTSSFLRPYGTGHSLHGHMDYFTKLKEMKDGGLIDIYAGYKRKIAAKWVAQLDYHYFSLAEAGFTDALAPQGYQEISDKALGSEFDLVISYQLAKSFMVQGGYSLMLQTATTEKLMGVANGAFSSWAYLSLTFKPRLFEKNMKL